MSYVKAAKELPSLQPLEVQEYARKYGLVDRNASEGGGRDARDVEEKPAISGGSSNTSRDVVDERGVESGFGDGVNASEKADRE